jgi:hypothetical protein
VADLLVHLEIMSLLCLRRGHSRKAQIAKRSSDGPGALGALVAGLPGKHVLFETQIPL